MFYGAGAGGAPTAPARCSATWSRWPATGVGGAAAPGESTYAKLPVLPMGETVTRYHVALDVTTGRACSPRSRRRSPSTTCRSRPCGRRAAARTAQLVVVTHRAPDAALSATVEELRELDIVREVASVMRVEGDE